MEIMTKYSSRCSICFAATVYYLDVMLIGYLESNVIDVDNVEYIDDVRLRTATIHLYLSL